MSVITTERYRHGGKNIVRDAGLDPMEQMRFDYSRMWRSQEKGDSPDKSRASLARRVHTAWNDAPASAIILDAGSGRQIFERGYFSAYRKPEWRIISFDFADIPPDRLLAQGKHVRHVQTDGTLLAFKDQSFYGVVSNMALDFMPKCAIAELHRVVKQGGKVLLNLHHPNLIPQNIDAMLKDPFYRKMRKILRFWQYLRDTNMLYASEEVIREEFTTNGFSITRVEPSTDKDDTWWEVDAIRT